MGVLQCQGLQLFDPCYPVSPDLTLEKEKRLPGERCGIFHTPVRVNISFCGSSFISGFVMLGLSRWL